MRKTAYMIAPSHPGVRSPRSQTFFFQRAVGLSSPRQGSRSFGAGRRKNVSTLVLRTPLPSAYTLAAGGRKQGAWTYLKERMA
jgi:hypothetical protein